jgi:hypothetical protein
MKLLLKKKIQNKEEEMKILSKAKEVAIDFYNWTKEKIGKYIAAFFACIFSREVTGILAFILGATGAILNTILYTSLANFLLIAGPFAVLAIFSLLRAFGIELNTASEFVEGFTGGACIAIAILTIISSIINPGGSVGICVLFYLAPVLGWIGSITLSSVFERTKAKLHLVNAY